MAGQGAATKGSDIRGASVRHGTINRGGRPEIIESAIDKAGSRVIPDGLDCPPLVFDGETPHKSGGGRDGTRACRRQLQATASPEEPPPCGTKLQAIRHHQDGEGARDRGAPPGERHDRRTGDDTLEISLVNDVRKVDGVTAQIEEFCAECNLAPRIARAVNLAVDELLSGTMAYGYDDDEAHRIEIIVCLEGDWLVVVMADDARDFDAWPAPKSDGGALIVEAMFAGARSLFLARMVVEGVRYRRTNGFNVVTPTKYTSH